MGTKEHLDAPAIAAQLPNAPLSQIADLIRRDWGASMSVYAKPYVRAMLQCPDIDSTYGADDARTVVLYFLANSGTWRGPVARLVKIELRRRVGQ